MIIVIEDIEITWTELCYGLELALANPIEIEFGELEMALFKKAFEYESGGKDFVKVGTIIKKIKHIFS
jgi:hypothetical protein